MYSIKRTDGFSAWLDGLKDRITRQRLNVHLRKAMLGNLGDVRPVGGGNKSTQSADIAKAVKLAATMEE